MKNAENIDWVTHDGSTRIHVIIYCNNKKKNQNPIAHNYMVQPCKFYKDKGYMALSKGYIAMLKDITIS